MSDENGGCEQESVTCATRETTREGMRTTHEDLVLKRSSIRSVGLGHDLLDLTSDARDRLDARALKLGDLEPRVEHVLDEGRVLEDLVRRSRQLKLLDNFGRPVNVEHDSRCRDSETGRRRVKRVERAKTRVGQRDGSVERRGAVHVLGRVLEQPVSD